MSNQFGDWISKIQIIDSTSDFLVIYKPEGLSFYEEGPKPDLMKIIRYMEENRLLPEGERIFPVHRLDKVTSGLLLFARGRKASSVLGNHFRFRRVQKIYLALSHNKPKKKQGVVLGDMTKSRRSKWKLLHSKENPAITMFKSYPWITKEAHYFRIFLLKPITGKTHQIRVMMKSLGAPIVGDPIYNRPGLARKEERTYLHSYAIQFEYQNHNYEYLVPPQSGTYFLHPELKDFLKTIGNPLYLSWKYKIPFYQGRYDKKVPLFKRG